jgi:opacity protein-like surface antigen
MRTLVLGALIVASGGAHAQATAPAQGGWSFELTPYLWGAAMNGTLAAGELPATSVDMSFSDILDHLDAGLMGALEARKGRWGILLDAVYMKLEASATTSNVSALVEMKQTTYAAALAYRAGEGRSPLDLVGGVRYLEIEADARIDGSFFGQTATVERSAKKSWADPYVGFRFQHPLAERWTFVGYADIGGFGVGSEFTWQTLAGVNYEFSKAIAGKAGYRYISVDYDKDGFAYDMAYDGLYFGVGIGF